jgi:hypothetical protein
MWNIAYLFSFFIWGFTQPLTEMSTRSRKPLPVSLKEGREVEVFENGGKKKYVLN